MSYCCIFLCFCLFHFVLKLYKYLHLIVKFTIRSIMSIRFFSLLFIWTSCDDMVSLSRLRFISTLMFTEVHVRFPNDAQVMTSVSLSFTSPPSIHPSYSFFSRLSDSPCFRERGLPLWSSSACWRDEIKAEVCVLQGWKVSFGAEGQHTSDLLMLCWTLNRKNAAEREKSAALFLKYRPVF